MYRQYKRMSCDRHDRQVDMIVTDISAGIMPVELYLHVITQKLMAQPTEERRGSTWMGVGVCSA